MRDDKKILLIDNYDSFTYNLYQSLLKICDMKIEIRQNDEITVDQVDKYDILIISPGPGLPDETPFIRNVIEEYYRHKPILGVCLGMQAIHQVFGGALKNMYEVCHGIESRLTLTEHSDHSMLRNLKEPIKVGRYHSWVIDGKTLNDNFMITSYSDDGNIMSILHREYCLEAVQFHPESIMTPLGDKMLSQYIDRAKVMLYKKDVFPNMEKTS